MSSLKMTFSLASLIFLIALGLVFFGTPAIADDYDLIGNNHRPDGHPSDQDQANTDETNDSDHTHPTVKSLKLKAGTRVSANGLTAFVTTAANTITLMVEFSEDVNIGAGNRDESAALANSLMTADNFDIDVRNANNVQQTTQFGSGNNQFSIGTVVRKSDSNSTYEVPLTVGSALIPDTTDDNPDDAATLANNSFTLLIRVKSAQAFSFSGPFNNPTGQGNLVGDAVTITLIASAVDETAPVVTITAPTPPQTGDLTFVVTSNESLAESGDGAFTAGDVTVTNGDITSGPTPTTGNEDRTSYDIVVDPTDATKAVIVALKADAVTDVYGNKAAASSGTYTPPAPPPTPVEFKVEGNPSLTSPFTVTFTAATAAELAYDDIAVTGGYAVQQSLNPKTGSHKVFNVIVQPYPATKMVSVTIADDSSTAAAAAAGTAGKISMQAPKATLNSITAATGANDQKPFLVMLTFAAALPTGIRVDDTDLMVTNGTAGIPQVDLNDSKKWNVLIRPTKGMDTEIGLSDAGKLKFAYSGEALTVMKEATAPTPGDITATYDAATMTTDLTGTIGANSFAVVPASALRDLEEFFDIGGTIGLHDADTADGDDDNSREVVISEILWGLDFGATKITDQKQWQFIELYNTTAASIDLTGWMLKFTEGRPVPKSDVDQVSNRHGVGWVVDIGQSGRVTGTRAVDATTTITAINIVSMYRNITYATVEKPDHDANATENRKKQLAGVPGGNGKGSWKASQRRDPNTPAGAEVTGAQAARWIYATRGGKHYTTTAILTASSVARSPFIINEVGNGSSDNNDWVEIRNVTKEVKSLKNYHLSYVSGHDKDTSLVNFKDKDIKVAAEGVLLLVNTSPQNTDIAAGSNAALKSEDQQNTGLGNKDIDADASTPVIPNVSRYYIDANLKLPDDGKFNLILRNAHDKLKASSNLMDVIGGLVITDDTKGTSLWPLVATVGPHGDVVDGQGRDLKAGYVYKRNDAGGGWGEHDLARAGYTGVGYDRTALVSDANGGTPGYDNGARKDKIDPKKDSPISISEIMLDPGEARQNLAQWIELYNSSLTEAYNLAGWKLHLENAASSDGKLETNTFSATLTLDAMTISPNQTILIVSSSGRVSNPDHFPSTRVVNLWTTKKYRDALEMTRRTDQVISTTGFNIKLVDKDNNPVDEAGNLDGNRRTRDEVAWMLPMIDDDGRRSSLIRIYDNGVTITGTKKEAWISADATNLAFAISPTFYGDADDFGTPGFRGGGPVPVSLSKFRPELLDTGEIVIRWITESELNNAGFNILRSEKRDGQFTKINTSLIKGQGTTSERTTYSLVDKSAKPNVVYYYQIQDVSLDGQVQTLRQSRLKGDVSPAGKLTTQWAEIKALQ